MLHLQKLEDALFPATINISQLASQWKHRPSHSDNTLVSLTYCTTWISMDHATTLITTVQIILYLFLRIGL